MELKNFKMNTNIKKLTNSHLLKSGKAVILASTMALANPQMVSANVDSENIFRDEDAITMNLVNQGYDEETAEFTTEYDKMMEQRTEARLTESQELADYFAQSADGERLENIQKAIEIADKLEELAPDALEYLSTSKDEVLALDIPALYDEMQVAIINEDEEKFKKEHISDLAALNAYNYFSTGTISETLTTRLYSPIIDYVASEGRDLYSIDGIGLNEEDSTIVIIITTDLGSETITFDGSLAKDISDVFKKSYDYYCNGLEVVSDNTYEPKEEDTFIYNGVDVTTGNSAWLVLNDANVKETLTDGLSLIETLNNQDAYELDNTIEEGMVISLNNPLSKKLS